MAIISQKSAQETRRTRKKKKKKKKKKTAKVMHFGAFAAQVIGLLLFLWASINSTLAQHCESCEKLQPPSRRALEFATSSASSLVEPTRQRTMTNESSLIAVELTKQHPFGVEPTSDGRHTDRLWPVPPKLVQFDDSKPTSLDKNGPPKSGWPQTDRSISRLLGQTAHSSWPADSNGPLRLWASQSRRKNDNDDKKRRQEAASITASQQDQYQHQGNRTQDGVAPPSDQVGALIATTPDFQTTLQMAPRVSHSASRFERSAALEPSDDEDHNQDHDQDQQVVSLDQADKPAHKFSLAKWKLIQKSEPSMINSALINGRAQLACDIQAPTSDDSVLLILWYKDDSLAPIYTLDARKVNSLDRAKVSLDEQYAGRLNFNLRSKPAQLELIDLRQDDEGEFRCRVDFKRGRTVNTIISLRIILPPTELAIYLLLKSTNYNNNLDDPIGGESPPVSGQKTRQLVQVVRFNESTTAAAAAAQTATALSGQLIGPFNEDEQLELLCLVRGGKPRPSIEWRRDFNVMNTSLATAEYLSSNLHLKQRDSTNSKADSAADETSAVLRLDSLKRQHLLSIFTCQASNSNLTTRANLQSSITLDLNLKPQEVIIRRVATPGNTDNGSKNQNHLVDQQQQQQQGALLVGQTATFECISTGSRPQATIHWLFQGQRHDSPMNVDQQQTASRLTLVLQRSFNQQPLTCVAENKRISSSSSSSSSSSGLGFGFGFGTTQNPSSNVERKQRFEAASKQTTIKLDVQYPPQLSVRLDNAGRQTIGEPSARQPQLVQTIEGDSVEPSQLQEGNDIYLRCHMDANPRPTKPILWRFNGRPIGSQQTSSSSSSSLSVLAESSILLANQQQQHQATIVVSNQSLVLRKVSRDQSGQYTCEAANEHGANTSRPFELAIRHAPVCATDDILTFEASVGQVVSVDCNVRANPAKSIHFSWFASYGDTNQNISAWLQRDASLDEQIDQSGSQLKFKIRDENSFALIKCKAKNEIGLQQKVCLFRIVQAKLPELRHTCSLSGANSASLQLQCLLNEHLKTSEYQMSSDGQESAGTRRNEQAANSPALDWMKSFREALKQKKIDEQLSLPQMRQVFPPDWLLVELYKTRQSQSPNFNQEDGPNSLSQNSMLSPQADNSDQNSQQESNFELQAYILVGSSDQLTRIKSIVEENKLFQAQPRDIYYVMTRQTQSAQNSTNQKLSNAETTNDDELHSTFETTNRLFDMKSVGAIEKDRSTKLADSFNFTIPNLEPKTAYKLLVYGQNLANKTRDWLVVKGATLALEPADETKHQIESKSFRIFQDVQETVTSNDSTSTKNNYSTSSSASKSLVMRSEQSDEKLKVGDEQHDFYTDADLQHDSHQARPSGGRSVDDFSYLLVQFQDYKDRALAYAKQRPLFTVSIALVGCTLLIVSFIYMSGLFVNLIRGHDRRIRVTSGVSKTNESNSSFSSASNSNDSNKRKRKRRRKRKPKGSTAKDETDDEDEDEEEHDDNDYNDDYDEQFDANQRHDSDGDDDDQGGLDGNHQSSGNCHHNCQDSTGNQSNGQNSPAQLNSSAALLPNEQFNAGSFLLHPSLLGLPKQLDAIALEQVTGSGARVQMAASPTTTAWLEASCKLHSNGQQSQRLLGSLDRRQRVSVLRGLEPIYMAQTETPNYGHHDHYHYGQHRVDTNNCPNHVGSIDRRHLSSLMPSFLLQEPLPATLYDRQYRATGSNEQEFYQPLFITTATATSTSAPANCQQLAYEPDNSSANRQKQLSQNSDNMASLSSSNECIMGQANRSIIREPAQSPMHEKRAIKKRGKPTQTSNGAVANNHRVAFDLSNQQQQQQQQLVATESLNELVPKCQQDSSSGSNNSTTNTTADSGHESPYQPANGLYDNSATGPIMLPANFCSEHMLAASQSAREFERNRIARTTIGGPTKRTRVSNNKFNVQNYDNQPASQMFSLMEFASPSSLESSTLVHSVDSSGAEHSSSMATQLRTATDCYNTEPGQQGTDEATTLMLQQNHRMASRI